MSALSRRRFLTITAAGIAAGPVLTRGALADLACETPLRRWRGTALGASAEILLYHPDQAEADRLVRLSLAEVARLEQVFSLYRADSELCRLNRAGKLINPSFDLVRLLAESQRFGAMTDGAFDVTVQPLWTLYAEHFRRPNADPNGPSAAAIASASRLVGYRDIVVEPERITFRRPGMAVTLNGIAQGYITDRVSELLQANGLEHVLVDLDEIRALGERVNGTPWPIGIEDPRQPGRVIKTVELSDRAMATSGGYGTQFDAVGEFNHIFDPTTGRCAQRYGSVSVIGSLAASADALSTAFSTMPLEGMRSTLKGLGATRAVVVQRDGSIVVL